MRKKKTNIKVNICSINTKCDRQKKKRMDLYSELYYYNYVARM